MGQGKDPEGVQVGKEEVKRLLFAVGMVLCVENPEDATKRKLLELINDFRNLEDTESMDGNLLFPYRSKE